MNRVSLPVASYVDRENIAEAIRHSHSRLNGLLTTLNESRFSTSDNKKLQGSVLNEAVRLERLVILEAASTKDFMQLQATFRSMVRAASVVVKWFPGTELSTKVETMKTQGIELLNALYEHIKELETGSTHSKLDKGLSAQRDQFLKVFTDFSLVFKGLMSIADIFANDDGYTGMQDVIASLERDDLSSLPLGVAIQSYDMRGDETRNPLRPGQAPRKIGGGFLAKKFDKAVLDAIGSKSPGFARLIAPQVVLQALRQKSSDQLIAYFTRFNDYVAQDVDTDYLMSLTKNSSSIGSIFKNVWDSFSSGSMSSSRRIG